MYVQICSVETKRRPRRNFVEYLYTSEQALEIFLAIDRALESELSYAEVFTQMRDAHLGQTPPVTPESFQAAELVTELQALRKLLEEQRPSSTGNPSSTGLTSAPDSLAQVEEIQHHTLALREQVTQLQGQVSALQLEVTQLRSERLTRTDLWRLAVSVLSLSAPDSGERLSSVLDYLGVTDLDTESVALQTFGLDQLFTQD